ncbi:hypothetical protein B0J18DRAFT_408896 [Chaetomium sp. MPI-SDFR-AT-0129]|nr:hypothetical protein B0J18DRAFT_408896 [Chaetomium sp. MPI-SDFR-AT-0129]
MQLTALTLLAGAVASVSAAALAPKDTSAASATSDKFTLFAKSDSQLIDGKPIQARDNRMWLSLPPGGQKARCGPSTPDPGVATLFIKDRELFLWGDEGHSHQKFGVFFNKPDPDNLEYFNDARDWPRAPALTSGWTVDWDSKSVEIENLDYLACSKSDGTYTVGLTRKSSSHLPVPSGCTVFTVQATRDDAPVGCEYSEVVNPDDFLKI